MPAYYYADPDDHGDVLDSVETLSAQWKRLCTKLRLQGTPLNKFQQDYPKDSMILP